MLCQTRHVWFGVQVLLHQQMFSTAADGAENAHTNTCHPKIVIRQHCFFFFYLSFIHDSSVHFNKTMDRSNASSSTCTQSIQSILKCENKQGSTALWAEDKLMSASLSFTQTTVHRATHSPYSTNWPLFHLTDVQTNPNWEQLALLSWNWHCATINWVIFHLFTPEINASHKPNNTHSEKSCSLLTSRLNHLHCLEYFYWFKYSCISL